SAVLHFSVTNGEGKSAGLYYHTTPSVKEGISTQTVVCPYNSTLGSVTLNNLKSETTYYYQAYALQDGDTIWGNVMQFRTEINPLTIKTEEVENITANSATLYLSVENNTDARLGFYFHTTSDVEKGQYITATQDKGNVYKAYLRNLKPDTYYSCQAVGVSGGDTIHGKTKSFQTLKNTANETIAATEALTVYPNPVPESGELIVELPFDPTDAWLNLTDMTGKTLKQIPVSSRKIVLTDLKAGFYILQIDRPAANGNIRYQAKVIVQ
ncbi:MAG: T9SS type A sorting domain-containing protein, partial [Bacteroidales bacterium]|nr:T9SS type A sorting domain-containing protein [Bacteroidales bacterium]